MNNYFINYVMYTCNYIKKVEDAFDKGYEEDEENDLKN